MCQFNYSQKGEFPNCIFTYFKGSHKNSSSICYDTLNHWGEAKVFDKEGKEIYHRELKYFVDLDTYKIDYFNFVQFFFDSNNSVIEAIYKTTPDTLAEWLVETILFDKNGKITDEKLVSHEYLISKSDNIAIYSPPYPMHKTIISQNNKMYEIWVFNRCAYPIIVEAKSKKAELTGNRINLLSKENKCLVKYKNLFIELTPDSCFSIEAYNSKNKCIVGKLRKRILKFRTKSKENNLSKFEYIVE